MEPMARNERIPHPYAFAVQGDFNEQVHDALRRTPWWMISIAVHLLVGAFLLWADTSAAQPLPPPTLQATQEMPPEEVEPPAEDPLDPIEQTQFETPEPKLIEDPVTDLPQDDNDMEFAEPLGNVGVSDDAFESPNTNGLIGIGADAGGAFGRRGGNRPGGGSGAPSRKFQDAVDGALEWLAAHQSPNGAWEAAGFMNWCDQLPAEEGRKPDGAGKSMYDAGVSGLSLCAFLGAGYTNRGDHRFARTVSRGLRHLKSIQDPEGCFGPRSTQQYIYNHATASLAMVEAYGMTGSPILKSSAQGGLDFIALTRNPYFAWRYGIKPGDNDTSVTGWMMMALKSAKLVNAASVARGKAAPLALDESAFDGIHAWLEKVTDKDTGRVGYLQRGTGPARPQDLVDRFPAEKSESMTGVGMLARIFGGEEPTKSEIIQKGAALCAKLPPTWNESDGSIDMYYWYYATLAMYQVGGRHWDAWKAAMEKAMVGTQHQDTDYCQLKGSWDPLGPWGPDGGRVYSTAVMALCLEVFYRYDRVFVGR
jgi:hypothetical protein